MKRKTGKNEIASFFLNGNPSAALFNKTYTIKDHVIETDSLLSYFNGYADIHVTGITEQSDTITTYEYDDNFEKKEMKTPVNVKVPATDLAIKSSPELFNYLQKQQIVTASQHINREIFPLYDVMAKQNGQTLFLNTNSQSSPPDEYENSNNFLEVSIDVEKLHPLLDSTFATQYIKDIDKINFAGAKTKETTVNIQGTITFKSGVIKAMEQIFNQLSKK